MTAVMLQAIDFLFDDPDIVFQDSGRLFVREGRFPIGENGQLLRPVSNQLGIVVSYISIGQNARILVPDFIAMTIGDMVQLMWNGTDWLQVSYSNN